MNGIVKISEFIYDNIGNDYESSVFIEKLILLDNKILLELFDNLMDNSISLESVMTLPTISNKTITDLIQVSKSADGTGMTYKDWVKLFDKVSNYEKEKIHYLGNTELFMRKSSIKLSNYFTKIKYDEFDPEKYLSEYIKFSDRYAKYIREENFMFTERYAKLKILIETLPWDGTYFYKLIDDVIDKQLLVETPFNIIPSRIRNNPDLLNILNRTYENRSPKIAHDVQDEIIIGLLKNDIGYQNLGYDYVKGYMDIDWGTMSGIRSNFIEEFEKMRIYKLFYKKIIYSRYYTRNSTNRDKNIITLTEQIFELMSEIFESIIHLSKDLADQYDILWEV